MILAPHAGTIGKVSNGKVSGKYEISEGNTRASNFLAENFFYDNKTNPWYINFGKKEGEP